MLSEGTSGGQNCRRTVPIVKLRPLWKPTACRAATYGLAIVLMFSGCASRRPAVNPPAPAPLPQTLPPGQQPTTQPPQGTTGVSVQYTEQGIASWYGAQFNGRRTSNGEIYNMFQYTAAHRTLPFGAVVQVTNLNNGKQVEVRINDRGPFVGNRVIDLSYSAAVAIGMIDTGTASVRLDVIAGPNPNIGFFGVQVGAFQLEQNATRLRDQLSTRYSPVTIATLELPDGVYYRVRVGRFPSQAAAQQLATEIHDQDAVVAFVVRLDN
jgi:rare lipoprotein A